MSTRALVPEDLIRDGHREQRAWGRALAALAIGARDRTEPAVVLGATWPDDRRAMAVLKAATSPTSTTGAGALLLNAVEVYRSLAPSSAALDLLSRGLVVDLTGLNSVLLPHLGAVPAPGVFIAEGQPAANLMFGFAAGVAIGPTRKILLLAATSRELENATPGTMSAVLQKILNDCAAHAIDLAAFGTQADDGVTPQGLLHGVTSVTAAAAGVNAMSEDIAGLLDAIAVNNIDTSGAVFIADAGTVGILKTRVGPKLDYPILTTLGLPAKTVACFAPAALGTGYDEAPTVEVSRVGAVHYESSTPLPISTPGTPPAVAAPVFSTFQNDLLSVKVRARCAWTVIPGGSSFVTTINW
jgi:hypothetical protein